jgi:translation initiation factor IF-2
MVTKRIYELAKEMGLASRDVLATAQDLGLPVTTASSGLDPGDAEALRSMLLPEEPEEDIADAEDAPDLPEEDSPPEVEESEPDIEVIVVPAGVSVLEMARAMRQPVGEVVKQLLSMGLMAAAAAPVPPDAIEPLGEHFGIMVEVEQGAEPEEADEPLVKPKRVFDDDPASLVGRPPVVTVMGHVDHGKTTLLDFIRNTNVVSGEAGGITQHIGAYQATVDGRPITFIDTPGHAAFTAMRARGSRVTDIVILVVAADDGVMPQTDEAIQHSKAAGVPIVVAVNKIDREDAQPERVMQELAGKDLVPEAWGGDTIFVNVSALTGEHIDELLDAVLLQAELLELRAPVDGPARGTVIESRLDRGRGPVATVLVQGGTLRRGDILLAGSEFGKVRGLIDERGREVERAGPSLPVEILGLSAPPEAGDEAVVVPSERKAREIATFRHGKHREVRLARQQSAKLENVFEQMKEGATHTLNIIVKADVQGSVEALRDALTQLSTDEVKVNVVTAAAGGISETDANLAVASNAIIIGFNVRADAAARRVIEAEMVDLRYFSVIYDVIDTVEQAMSGMLAPEFREEIIGIAEVRDIFRSKRFGNIAGCRVSEGTVRRSNPIRVLRDSVVIYEGELESLRRFQDDVNEVRAGTECGIGVRNYNDVKVGDQIEVYERIQLQRTL